MKNAGKNQRFTFLFSAGEIVLWVLSVAVVILSHIIFGGSGLLNLSASVIGVTSLILCAKGRPSGQALMIVFSVLYGIISFSFSYYGEMITYLGMTMPMSVASLVAWIKNPYDGNRSQVAVRRLGYLEYLMAAALTVAVTAVFYFILKAMGTTNIIPGTVSVATSFFSVYLTFRRSPYYAVAYAANDVVLVILWIMAAVTDTSYISVAICFSVFLINDIYGFICWKKMEKSQMGDGARQK